MRIIVNNENGSDVDFDWKKKNDDNMCKNLLLFTTKNNKLDGSDASM